MSELYDNASEEAPAPPASPGGKDADYWEAEAKKAFAARDEARQDLRKKIESAFDPEVVDLVPKNLSPMEWEEYANKLVAFRTKTAAPVAPENSSEAPEPEAGEPAETLAGIVNGPSGTASSGQAHVSHSEWLRLVESDSAEAQRLLQSGKVDFSTVRRGLGPN